MATAEPHGSVEGAVGRKVPVPVLGCGSAETPTHLAGMTRPAPALLRSLKVLQSAQPVLSPSITPT